LADYGKKLPKYVKYPGRIWWIWKHMDEIFGVLPGSGKISSDW